MIPSLFLRHGGVIALAVVALAMLLVWGVTRSSSREGGAESASPGVSSSSDGALAHVRKARIRSLSDQARPLDQVTHTIPLRRSTRLPGSSEDSTSSSGSAVQHADPGSPRLRPIARVPFSFSIPEGQINVGSPEEEVLHQAQLKFVQDMNSVPNADTGSAEYADRWNRSAVDHDHHIRLFLGGPAYFQLSAKALQAEQAAREKSNVDNAASPQ